MHYFILANAELSVVEAATNEVCKAAEDVRSSDLMGGLSFYAFSFFKSRPAKSWVSESSAPQWAGTDLIMPLYSFYSPRPSLS
jgi:hypothetical protein